MQARHFYNKKHKESKAERNQSPHLRLRKFNNAIKSILISDALRNRPNATVLDLCCGTGGDLAKYQRTSTGQWVGVDISRSSIEEAIRRYKTGRYKFTASFYCGDGFQKPVVAPGSCDLVSCQFALHYAFGDDVTANYAFHEIASALKPGGSCIATFPNALVIRPHLPHWQAKYFEITAHEDGYLFSMGESVQNVQEWLVDPEQVATLAEQHGLRIVQWATFDSVFRQAQQTGRHDTLLSSLEFSDAEVDEFSLDHLYVAVNMQKL